MPHGHLDLLASAVLSLFGAEELSHDGLVGDAGPVHGAGLHVLPLGMVDELLGHDVAAGEQDTLDLEVGLLTGHADAAEGVLAVAVKSLDETFEQVLELVGDLTLIAELVVVDVVEGEALLAGLLEHLVDTSTLLVGVVDHEGLEVEKTELASLREFIKWVGGLLLLTISSLGLGGSGSSLGLLLLSLDNGLERLGGHLDLTEDGDEFGKGRNARKPSAALGSGLLEALVEDELEGTDERSGEDDISDGDAVSNDPVTSEGLIDRSGVLLDALDGIVELRLGDLSVAAEDGVEGGHGGLEDTRLNPVHPLVDLSTLDGVGTEEGSVTVSQELGDGVGLLEVALGGLKNGELVGGVEGLVSGSLSLLFAVNDGLDGLASELGDDNARVDEGVSGELGVDFLREKDTKLVFVLSCLDFWDLPFGFI